MDLTSQDNSSLCLSGKTILQVIPHLETGGAERTTIDMTRAITTAGGRALVASQGGRLVKELEKTGGTHIPLNVAGKWLHQILWNKQALTKLIKAEAIDLVHARSRAPAWTALFACRQTQTPFVTTYHGIYSQKYWPKSIYNSVMARGDAVIANSNYTARLICQRHPFARERVKVIYRGVDIEQFAPEKISEERKQALRKAWHIPQNQRNRPIVLNVARLTPWKGQEVLIKAIIKLRQQGHVLPLFILAGDAPTHKGFQTQLHQMISCHGLENDILLVGHCADIPTALSLASLCVVASIREEAFGRAAVEASAMGVPVIVTSHGATDETVLVPPHVEETARTGWHIQPNNVDALAETLVEAQNCPDKVLKKIGTQAQMHVLKNFSLSAMCKKTLSVYAQMFHKSQT